MAERIDANLQIWQARAVGDKPQPTVYMNYVTAQTNQPEYRVVLANHRYYPIDNAQETGRITFSVTDVYWQGTRIQAKEVFNKDPLSLGQDTTLDGGYTNLHGFKVESIVPAGERHILLKIVGTGLTFDDVLEMVDMIYPTAA